MEVQITRDSSPLKESSLSFNTLPGIAAALVIVLTVFEPASALGDDVQQSITVEDAVRMARSSPRVTALVDARQQAAQANVREVSTFNNPQISWEREQMHRGDATERENAVVLSKEFVVSGKRGLRIESARLSSMASKEQSAKLVRDLEIRVRRAYFEALYHQRIMELLEQVLVELRAGLERMEHRYGEGEIPKFDFLRFKTEVAGAEADLREAQSVSKESRLALFALINPPRKVGDTDFLLLGELLPQNCSAAMANVNSSDLATVLPEIRSLEHLAKAESLEARAAGRDAVPSVSLSAGYKTAKGEEQRAHGFIVGVGLPLPLFDNGSRRKDRHLAAKQELQSRRSLLLSEAEAHLLALETRFEILAQAASKLADETKEAGAEMTEAARSSYEEGSIGVTELIDTITSLTQMRARVLSLSLGARLASEELICLAKGGGK